MKRSERMFFFFFTMKVELHENQTHGDKWQNEFEHREILPVYVVITD